MSVDVTTDRPRESDADGNIVDENLRERLKRFVHGFVAFARGQRN
jgi:hypothetical protein